MSDLREVFGDGKERRNRLDDEHTQRMYRTFSKRAEMINSMLSLTLVLGSFAVLAGIIILVALTVHLWKALV